MMRRSVMVTLLAAALTTAAPRAFSFGPQDSSSQDKMHDDKGKMSDDKMSHDGKMADDKMSHGKMSKKKHKHGDKMSHDDKMSDGKMSDDKQH